MPGLIISTFTFREHGLVSVAVGRSHGPQEGQEGINILNGHERGREMHPYLHENCNVINIKRPNANGNAALTNRRTKVSIHNYRIAVLCHALCALRANATFVTR